MSLATAKQKSLFLLGCLWMAAAFDASAFTAAFSVRPLAGIASAIAEGSTVEVTLILSDAVSPHEATLKPSHITKINQADMVMVVNKHFETFLVSALDEYAPNKTVEASSVPGMSLYRKRQFVVVETDDHGIIIPPPPMTGDTTDYHLWLEPENARSLAAYLRDRFTKGSPMEAQKFADNYAAFDKMIDDTHAKLLDLTYPFNAKPFIVYHDSYQYFDERYNIRQDAIISDPNSEEIGPKRLEALDALVKKDKITCAFFEPEEGRAYTQKFAARNGIQASQVDPLGQSIPLSRNYYPSLLTSVAGAFARCLNQS